MISGDMSTITKDVIIQTDISGISHRYSSMLSVIKLALVRGAGVVSNSRYFALGGLCLIREIQIWIAERQLHYILEDSESKRP